MTSEVGLLLTWITADDGSHCTLGFDLEFLIVPRAPRGSYLIASVAFQPGQLNITTVSHWRALPNKELQPGRWADKR
jgi:hypothetical protein